ncbi:DNA adenine methylase [Morganella morganii]|uniref:DNA adenine methylase n=1 Tax=Morganella morganii TaxID=582 RepID=UPI0005FADA8E|nr:Dam family site-specific DNA-(adenine-N6)-methyltransferase [Morganella morganii]HDS3053823.1 Dam family site-specific DNA-(adenine-N6)-methyltransferase [Morganella morganii subsp. morganii]KJY02813.1 DNA adenine methylase [Morganella morganii]MDU2632753.1 Dam family site-specific DNA-(adenine-N6)-methyltransferase [Morganella morganii]STZ15912.1 DNA adenine methylase [Morganella morganii]HDU8710571.1 Dam family site-specific DNA-(adenine-N6)-methyltransferase [Morganella morganii subsp. m
MAEKTILKWAGSKVGIMEQLRPYLPKTKRLVEPFAGSCAVMMNTDYERYLIADINDDLINLYREIKSGDYQRILNTAYGLFELESFESGYYVEREFFNRNKKFINPADAAAYFIYLNRHCYNGLCRYNQSGAFNVPKGSYKKPYLPEEEIIRFSKKAVNAEFKAQSAGKTLQSVKLGDGVYCDPPYLGTFSGYSSGGFSEKEHENLAYALLTLNLSMETPITVSNSMAAKELYADLGFTIHVIEAPRTIAANGNRKKAPEIIAVLGGCQ